MLFPGHVASGGVAWLAGCAMWGSYVAPVSGTAFVGGTVVCAAAASLPDIDTPTSTISASAFCGVLGAAAGAGTAYAWHRLIGHVSLTGAAKWCGILAAAFLVADLAGDVFKGARKPIRDARRVFWAFVVTPLTGGHRARTHTVLFAALAGWAAWWVGAQVGAGWSGWAVALGCLMHLVGDWLTVAGVPAGWPVSRERYAAALFSTGGRFEVVVVTPLLYASAVGLAWWFGR